MIFYWFPHLKKTNISIFRNNFTILNLKKKKNTSMFKKITLNFLKSILNSRDLIKIKIINAYQDML
ncbi:hypothetical protein DQW92_01850 [Metamycoplasma hominis]|nr:hypothetical protein DQW92_01850 [Metamycoplasma hominis]RCJ01729.1 hypothetical protein DSL67_01805 [Metamycoplasma hominis]